MARFPVGPVAPYIAYGPYISEIEIDGASTLKGKETEVGADVRAGLNIPLFTVDPVSVVAFLEYRFTHTEYTFRNSPFPDVHADLQTHSGILGFGVEF